MTLSPEDWDRALNLVDEKVQELKHLGFAYLSKRPYRSELKESSAAITYTLYVDPLSENVLRAVVQAQSHTRPRRTFAYGFDQHRDGQVGELSMDTLRAFE